MAAPSVSHQPAAAATSSSRSRSPVRRSTATSTRRSRASRSPVPPSCRTSLSPLRKQNSTASGSQRALLAQQGSFVNLLGGRSLSPCRPSSSSRNVPKSALERATSAPTNNSFLQYCQIHGHQVSKPELNRGGSVPLNRCSLTGSSTHSLNSFGNSFSSGMDGSSASLDGSSKTAAGFKRQISTAADRWLDSWKLSGSNSDHCSPGNNSSYYVQQHPLGRHCKTLQYSQADMLNVAMDDQTFRMLKSGLRKRGVITNNYLRENMHFYVQHIKKVEERKQQQQRARCHSPMGRNAAA